MCTVTYIPPSKKQGFVLTSNRDERSFRPTLSPAFYTYDDKLLVYPKDEEAGGSWIAANKDGRVCCLLNGGFVSHQKQDFHTVSRGTILLQLTSSELSAEVFFGARDLQNVEPFTVVTIEQSDSEVHHLCEFIWDGQTKNFTALDKEQEYIWSSATLYNTAQRQKRREWFAQFLVEANTSPTAEEVYGFHSGGHTDDVSFNLIMQREGGLKTVSITQITQQEDQLIISYHDMVNSSKHELLL